MDIKILRATEEWQRAGAYSMPLRSLRFEVWGVILEPPSGDRIHKQFKNVQVQSLGVFDCITNAQKRGTKSQFLSNIYDFPQTKSLANPHK